MILFVKMNSNFSILPKVRTSYLHHVTVAKIIINYQDFMRPITKPSISDMFSLNTTIYRWLHWELLLFSVTTTGLNAALSKQEQLHTKKQSTWNSCHSPVHHWMIYCHSQRSTGFALWCSSASTGRRWSHPPPSQLWEAKQRSPLEMPPFLEPLLTETKLMTMTNVW